MIQNKILSFSLDFHCNKNKILKLSQRTLVTLKNIPYPKRLSEPRRNSDLAVITQKGSRDVTLR